MIRMEELLRDHFHDRQRQDVRFYERMMDGVRPVTMEPDVMEISQPPTHDMTMAASARIDDSDKFRYHIITKFRHPKEGYIEVSYYVSKDFDAFDYKRALLYHFEKCWEICCRATIEGLFGR